MINQLLHLRQNVDDYRRMRHYTVAVEGLLYDIGEGYCVRNRSPDNGIIQWRSGKVHYHPYRSTAAEVEWRLVTICPYG